MNSIQMTITTSLIATALAMPVAAQQPNVVEKAIPSPRAALDKAAGYVPDEAFRKRQQGAANIEEPRGRVKNRPTSPGFPPNSLSIKTDQYVAELKLARLLELMELKAEEAELAEKFGANHPKLIAFRRRIEFTEQLIAGITDVKDDDKEHARRRDGELERSLLQFRKREERLKEADEKLVEALKSAEGEEAETLRKKREQLLDEMAAMRLKLIKLRKEASDRDRREEEHVEHEDHEHMNHPHHPEFEQRLEQVHACLLYTSPSPRD